MGRVYVGSDVSKAKIDFAFMAENKDVLGQYCIENTVKSLMKFFKKYTVDQEFLVVCESTGSYHHRLMFVMEELSIPYSVVNPMRIHNHRKSLLKSAKTDPADARLIADFAVMHKPEETKLNSKLMIWSQSVLKAIDDLNHELSAMTNRLEALDQSPYASKEVKTVIKKSISFFEKQIKHLENQLKERMNAEMKYELELLMDIPGVGVRLASTILAFLGRFESFESSKQVISYIGTDPAPRESGVFKGKRKISKRGNRYIRHMLYMPSIAASRYNKSCTELANRMRAKGKHGKQVYIAVGNKLMRQIFAVLKHNEPWSENYKISGTFS